jgi:L-fucose mutarotase
MLIGISPVISPDLLTILDRMGHGDEIVLSDAFYPADTCNKTVIRADGIKIPQLLDGILRLINIDPYVKDSLVMMAPVKGDKLDPSVEKRYYDVIKERWPDAPSITRISRFDFYERSKSAFAVVVTGETATYGNIIIKKGVTPIAKEFQKQ